MEDRSRNGDQFGQALATGDFDADGFADLAAGVPSDAIGPFDGPYHQAGSVHILYGSERGLTGDRDLIVHRGLPELGGRLEGAAFFGRAVQAGDFNGDGYDDLAATGSLVADSGEGGVTVLFGGSAGLRLRGSQLLSQDMPRLAGPSVQGDRFGSVLAAGDFDADGFEDLAAAAEAEDFFGGVHVLRGSNAGLTASGSGFFTGATPGVAGPGEAFDSWAAALVAGDFGRGPSEDLAVGVPDDVCCDDPEAAAVVVLYGSSGSLQATGSQRWTQASPGIADHPQQGDQFGFSLFAADLGRDAHDELAVGAPREQLSPVASVAGAVHVLFGSPTGLTARNSQLWHQDVAGVPDVVERRDRFGYSLSAGQFGRGRRTDLVVGVPGEFFGSGAVTVLYSTPRGRQPQARSCGRRARRGSRACRSRVTCSHRVSSRTS